MIAGAVLGAISLPEATHANENLCLLWFAGRDSMQFFLFFLFYTVSALVPVALLFYSGNIFTPHTTR